MQPLAHQVDVITDRNPCARCSALAIEAHVAACHGRTRLAARLEKNGKKYSQRSIRREFSG